MKSFIFLVGTTIWGVQNPHELIRYCSPIYVMCVSSHFWSFTKANLVLESFNKNLGFGQTPPPCWAKCPTFSEKPFWGPLLSILNFYWRQFGYWNEIISCRSSHRIFHLLRFPGNDNFQHERSRRQFCQFLQICTKWYNLTFLISVWYS